MLKFKEVWRKLNGVLLNWQINKKIIQIASVIGILLVIFSFSFNINYYVKYEHLSSFDTEYIHEKNLIIFRFINFFLTLSVWIGNFFF